jgi:hypothetical protein
VPGDVGFQILVSAAVVLEEEVFSVPVPHIFVAGVADFPKLWALLARDRS